MYAMSGSEAGLGSRAGQQCGCGIQCFCGISDPPFGNFTFRTV